MGDVVKAAKLVNEYLDTVNVSMLSADERRVAIGVLRQFVDRCNRLGDLSKIR